MPRLPAPAQNMTDLHGQPTDPYRIFFPLGIVMGVAGVSIWPLYYWNATDSYSGRAHGLVQTDGFLYCFVAGFLLTAIPRFTGTEAPSRRVQYALAAVLVFSAAAFELQAFASGNTAFVAAHFILITLAVRRFRRRQQDPPPTFVLVGAGLIGGALGAVINAALSWGIIEPFWDLLGKRLLTEGMVMLLALGVGGFLGPRLMGFAELPKFTNITIHAARRPFQPLFLIAGLAILFSLIAEYGFEIPAMAFLRAAVVTALILGTVRPWRFPAAPTTLARCVWVAYWLIVVAVWLIAFAPRYRVDFLHALFIGGFSLLILAVGTRVSPTEATAWQPSAPPGPCELD